MAYSVTVIGGSNIDISATSESSLVFGDSNPGHVAHSFGGVGRNIAENLARLGVHTQLITAYGDDAFAALLKAQAAELGLDISQSLDVPHHSSSLYICVNQPDGEISVAVSDMEVCEWLTPAFLQDKLPYIHQSDALILDANLSEETLTFLAEHCTVPLFADSVSSKKVRRLKAVLPKLTGLKINRREAELLTTMSVEKNEDAIPISKALHSLGVKQTLITLGEKGAFFSNGKETLFMPSLVQTLVNTTGCGDACLAGMVFANLHQETAETILKTSLAMAGLCAQAQEAVSPQITAAALVEYMKPC